MENVYVVFFIVAIIIAYVVYVQNKLCKYDELCKTSLRQLNVQQLSRFDAIKSLFKSINETASIKGLDSELKAMGLLLEDIKLNSSPSPSVDEIRKNRKQLLEADERLKKLFSLYPKLEEDENFAHALHNLNTYEEGITETLNVYAKNVIIFNKKVRRFPSNLVALMLGFPARDPYNL